MGVASRRHLLTFYLSLTVGVLAFIAMGVGMLIGFARKLGEGPVKPMIYFMPVVAIISLAFAVYTIYRYIKHAPHIIISENDIAFNDEQFSVSDISKVDYTGKRPFVYVLDIPMEAATVHLTNGREIYIFDDMYQNAWELKSYLKHLLTKESKYWNPEISKVDNYELTNEPQTTYKGSQFLSLRGLSFWTLTVYFIYRMRDGIPVSNMRTSTPIFLFLIFWFGVHAWLMNYFHLSESFLTIRNHLLFFKKKVYRVEDIREIVFETRTERPNCLRVITKDFQSSLYPAGTLRNHTWVELKKELRRLRIKVRDELNEV